MKERADNKPRMRWNDLETHYTTGQGGNGHGGGKRRGWMRADNKEANFRRQQEGK